MRLLVTRPAHDFDALAARLEIKGHEAVRAPLLTIVPLAFDLPDPVTCGGLVFSSANAVRILADRPDLKNYTGLPVAAVGAATADAARAAGFANIIAAGRDIGDLARLLRQKIPGCGATFVHLAGKERAGDLVALIGAEGPAIATIDIYRADAARAFPEPAGTEVRAGRIDGCILMSPRTAAIYTALIIEAGLATPARAMIHLCLSQNVAGSLVSLGLDDDRIRVAPVPELDSILSLV